MTNGQLSLEHSAIMLAQTVNRIIKDIESEKENDLLFYSRLAQAPAFRDLRMAIANKALGMIAQEWDSLYQMAPKSLQDLGLCECSLLLQYGLPCRHHLYHFYLSGQAIPRSCCHPRWWLNGGSVTITNWGPYQAY